MRTLFDHSYIHATNRIDAERRADKRKEAAQLAARTLAEAADEDEEDKEDQEALLKPAAPSVDVPTAAVETAFVRGDKVQMKPSAVTSGSLPEQFSLCEGTVVDASDMPAFLQV